MTYIETFRQSTAAGRLTLSKGDFGLVLKIWDLGLGFGIYLHKIRDLGSRIPDPWLGVSWNHAF